MSVSQTVLLASGEIIRRPVHIYQGACLAGDPTAYVVVGDRWVWVRPGESVSWIEA